MADFDKLQQALETNFRLSILHARDIGTRLNQRMDGVNKTNSGLTRQMDQMTRQMDQMTRQMDQMTRQMSQITRQVEHVSEELSELGREVQLGFHTMADDQQKVLDVLSALGDGSVDLRKELADLKARVEVLEKRAS